MHMFPTHRWAKGHHGRPWRWYRPMRTRSPASFLRTITKSIATFFVVVNVKEKHDRLAIKHLRKSF